MFWTLFLENVELASRLNITTNKTFYNRLANPLSIFHVGLFDIWLENDDRKELNYNLLFQPTKNNKLEVLPIDHAFIFGDLMYSDLSGHSFNPIFNENLFCSDLGLVLKKYTIIDKEFIDNEKTIFYRNIEASKVVFEQFTGFFESNDPFIEEYTINEIRTFLFDEARNEKVFDHYQQLILK